MGAVFKIISVCCLAAVFSASTVSTADEPNVNHIAWASGIMATGCLGTGSIVCIKEGIKKLYECRNSEGRYCFKESFEVCVGEGTESCADSARQLLAAYLIFHRVLPLGEALHNFKTVCFGANNGES